MSVHKYYVEFANPSSYTKAFLHMVLFCVVLFCLVLICFMLLDARAHSLDRGRRCRPRPIAPVNEHLSYNMLCDSRNIAKHRKRGTCWLQDANRSISMRDLNERGHLLYARCKEHDANSNWWLQHLWYWYGHPIHFNS